MTKLASSLPLRLAALTAVALIVASALLIEWLGAQSNQALADETGITLAHEARVLEAQFAQGGLPRLAIAVDEFAKGGPPSLYLLTGADGRKLAGSLDAWPVMRSETGAISIFGYGDGRLAAGHVVAIAGGARLLIARDIEGQRRLGAAIRRGGWLGLAGLGALAAGMGFALRRAILARIARITGTAQSIMHGDMHDRIPLDGSGDEFDQLAAHLNAMLARLSDLVRAFGEVSDNIAHDLRTPLARLRNHAEGALREPSGPAQRLALEGVIEQADELIKQFNAVLLITRLDRGGRVDRQQVELSDLVEGVVELYQPVAEEAGLTLVRQGKPWPAPVHVDANPQLLGQAFANLIDNAIKYAGPANGDRPGSTEIDIEMTATSTEVSVHVRDHGPGIPEADRRRVLERYVRLEKSRSQSGTGLGLSLVDAVAHTHGATFTLADNHPGLHATFTLPRKA